MINLIQTNIFTFQKNVNFGGENHFSVYNHNYYTSANGQIILEECDDDNTFYYYNVDPNTGDTEYYGLVDSTSGIFDEDYDGFPYKNDEGVIELNSDFC